MNTTTEPALTRPQHHDTSVRQAALVAASGLLVMAVLSPLAFFGIFPKLIVSTDIAQTIQNITAHQGLFLAGISCYLVTFVADLVVAWAMFVFVRPLHPSLSLLAASFRIVYATMALTALTKLVTVLRLVRSPDYLAAYGPDTLAAQVHLLVISFKYEWNFGMVVFALHLGALSALVLRSNRIPGVFGLLLAINSAAYLVDTLRPYLFPGFRLPYLFFAFFGELVFMLWLFVKGGTYPAERTQ